MRAAVKRRRYDSPRRSEQARETRRAILEAARLLFTERGYGSTTIGAVAGQARVAAETIYAAFGNKRSILAELVDVSIAGDDAPVPILERPWVLRLREEPDPRARLRILARNGRSMLERSTPILEVLRGAAATDPEIAGLWRRYKAQRLEGQRVLLGIVTEGGGLREGLTPDTALDVVFTLGSPETYGLLVGDRGWSPAAFERWYEDALARLLLPPRGPHD
jgi:AcrR family transcriptional regulator